MIDIRQKQQVSVALVGIGGMGLPYLVTLLEELPPEIAELRAAVDPFPQRSERYLELKNRGIPIYRSLSEFYESSETADLMVICSPIHHHVPQSCQALSFGSHVLCEKPLGATVQEAESLIQAKDASGRWVMIGYQWSFSEAIQALKRDILKGIFGKPVRLKTVCLWPRDEGYYRRNNWAGRKRDEAGRWILDSPANNAMAHFLHNLFYVLGERIDRSAKPLEVTAELYRAYSIENFDSIACRIFTESGAELLFYASHAVPQEVGPIFSFEFEQATVTYGEHSPEIIAGDNRGNEKNYGSPEAGHPFHKLFEAVASVKEPKPVLCGPEAASSQTMCVNGIQESVTDIATFPESMIEQEEKERRCWVKSLAEAFYDCYQKGILPSEGSFAWASRGRTVDLSNYRFFPGGFAQAEGKGQNNEPRQLCSKPGDLPVSKKGKI